MERQARIANYKFIHIPHTQPLMTSLSCPRVCDVILNEFVGLVVFDGVMMTAHARSESTHVASNLARLQLLARDVITKI